MLSILFFQQNSQIDQNQECVSKSLKTDHLHQVHSLIFNKDAVISLNSF